MRIALINENKVARIDDVESIDLIPDAHQFQLAVDVTDFSYGPEIGWTFDLGQIYKSLPNATPRQIRQALILSGVSMADIETALNSLPEPTRSLALVEWEYSTAFIRRNPLVMSVGMMLGWTEKQVDDLWELGLSL